VREHIVLVEEDPQPIAARILVAEVQDHEDQHGALRGRCVITIRSAPPELHDLRRRAEFLDNLARRGLAGLQRADQLRIEGFVVVLASNCAG